MGRGCWALVRDARQQAGWTNTGTAGGIGPRGAGSRCASRSRAKRIANADLNFLTLQGYGIGKPPGRTSPLPPEGPQSGAGAGSVGIRGWWSTLDNSATAPFPPEFNVYDRAAWCVLLADASGGRRPARGRLLQVYTPPFSQPLWQSVPPVDSKRKCHGPRRVPLCCAGT